MNVQKAKGRPMAADLRHDLARIVANRVDSEVASEIGCCPNTLFRALAGAPVYPLTERAVRAYVEAQRAKAAG
jgi:hypothetical protein